MKRHVENLSTSSLFTGSAISIFDLCHRSHVYESEYHKALFSDPDGVYEGMRIHPDDYATVMKHGVAGMKHVFMRKDNLNVRQYMGAFGINHKLRIGESALLESALAATVNGLDMHTEKMNDDIVPVPENAIANTNWNFVFTSSLQKRFGEHHTNRTGIRLTGMMYDMLMRQAPQAGTTFSFINLQGDEDLFIAREMVNGGKGLNYGHRYNYVTHKVEAEREANIIPNISYKIEF